MLHWEGCRQAEALAHDIQETFARAGLLMLGDQLMWAQADLEGSVDVMHSVPSCSKTFEAKAVLPRRAVRFRPAASLKCWRMRQA